MYEEWKAHRKKTGMVSYIKKWKESYLIFKSGFFDANYYLRAYPDVSQELTSGFFYRLSISKIKIFRLIGKAVNHPIRHYVWHGVYEGRNPSVSFDTRYYVENNHDVASENINPFLHYITYGIDEGRKAKSIWGDFEGNSHLLSDQIRIIKESGLFDEDYYLTMNIDVRNAQIDPIEHFCKYGWKEERNPNSSFNTKNYLKKMSELYGEVVNPLYHYILCGNESGFKFSRVNQLVKRDQTIVFIGHEAEATGAPIILLDVIEWFDRHTSYKVKVILLRGGKLIDRYKDVAETLVLNNLKNKNDIKNQIDQFINTENCMLFLNTVASARIFDFINADKYPKVAFIHELEKTLRLFPDETIALKQNVQTIISASSAVTDNLVKNHGFNSEEVTTVFAFINPQHLNLDEKYKIDKRTTLNLPINKKIVFGCGSVYWRKNPKGFIDVAEKIIKNTEHKCEFIWIGEGEELSDCKSIVIKKKLEKDIKFIGPVDNPRDYFSAGDIFMLTSIEDPFPLACLEAAECGLPILCFDEAGGMPLFVEKDAGVVVPYKDYNAMAQAAITLIEDDNSQKLLGKNAREKVLARHTISNSVQKIKKIIDKKLGMQPLVSIIVPNYNHAQYLHERLQSIYNQSFQDIEVILMDDVSSDDSRAILDDYANKYSEITTKLYNSKNSGNVFTQWMNGISASNGELVWIAESDDYCENDFLENVLCAFNDPEVVLSYSNSNIIGSKGQHYNTYDNAAWLTDLNENKWKSDYVISGYKEFQEALAIKCTIPNVSGVVFRKNVAETALQYSFKYKKAGDWIFYAHVVMQGKVSYCAQALNYHRRHDGTVTSKEGDKKGIVEIFEIHKHFVNVFPTSMKIRNSMINFVQKEYNIYFERGSITTPLNELYNFNDIINAPFKIKVALYQHGLNFGKGGAEKILIEKANFLFSKGYEVRIYNKTTVDNPLPYKLNSNIEVIKINKDTDIINHLYNDKPNVIIIFSIGHPDSQIIQKCHEVGVPTILSMHNQPAFFDKSPGLKEHTKALELSDAVVTLLPSFKEHYVNKGIRTKIEVIPNFVCQPEVDGKFNGIPNRKYIFNAGRLVEQKQQELLIDAFANLASDYKDWDLVIAGEGHLRTKLESKIKKYGLSNRVILIGQVDNIGDYYKNCEMFVLSSKFEGFSLAPIEASSFGKPVVVFKDCTPYGETFGVNDIMVRVDEMTPLSLEMTLRELIEGKRFFSKEQVIQFYNEYSPQYIIPKWESLIAEVIKEFNAGKMILL
ncbi:glycosyltransferase [Paenibacillus barengoltzii]|uniref:glycosyltransferase n=1 Tax=Paenibacillus barengoltzii TaxID=343517 RepID=UPI0003A067CB|nr:glycosyltransferase [Paenibacillus barengoltzii]